MQAGLVGFDTHDIAVIGLDEPVAGPRTAPCRASVSPTGSGRGRSITSVGYGVQQLIPSPGGKVSSATASGSSTRQSSIVSDENRLDAVSSVKLYGEPTGENGGICFGDSGDGRNFQSGTNIILRHQLRSSRTRNCSGSTYSYRADTASARAFLAPWLALYG